MGLSVERPQSIFRPPESPMFHINSYILVLGKVETLDHLSHPHLGACWQCRISIGPSNPNLHCNRICRAYLCALDQRSPFTGPWTSTSLWPVRNRATQQEVNSRRASEASSVFTAAPHRSHYHLSSTSCQISAGIRLS